MRTLGKGEADLQAGRSRVGQQQRREGAALRRRGRSLTSTAVCLVRAARQGAAGRHEGRGFAADTTPTAESSSSVVKPADPVVGKGELSSQRTLPRIQRGRCAVRATDTRTASEVARIHECGKRERGAAAPGPPRRRGGRGAEGLAPKASANAAAAAAAAAAQPNAAGRLHEHTRAQRRESRNALFPNPRPGDEVPAARQRRGLGRTQAGWRQREEREAGGSSARRPARHGRPHEQTPRWPLRARQSAQIAARPMRQWQGHQQRSPQEGHIRCLHRPPGGRGKHREHRFVAHPRRRPQRPPPRLRRHWRRPACTEERRRRERHLPPRSTAGEPGAGRRGRWRRREQHPRRRRDQHRASLRPSVVEATSGVYRSDC